MQIKKRYILAALALGLVIGFFLQEYVSSQPDSIIPVIVAETDISAGTVLKSGNLQVIQWPRKYLPTQTAQTVKQAEGKVITQPVAKGEPVLLPKLAQPVMKEVI